MPSSISQAAAVAALTGRKTWCASAAKRSRSGADLVVAALNASPGLRCRVPEGASTPLPAAKACWAAPRPGGMLLAHRCRLLRLPAARAPCGGGARWCTGAGTVASAFGTPPLPPICRKPAHASSALAKPCSEFLIDTADMNPTSLTPALAARFWCSSFITHGVKQLFRASAKATWLCSMRCHDADIAVTVCRQEGGAAMMAEAQGSSPASPASAL